MSNSVLAIQNGFDFQAKFFWLKATLLFRDGSNAVRISWEKDAAPGFDDVVIYYSPAKTRGRVVFDTEYFQLKFHVTHNDAFTYENLTVPAFDRSYLRIITQKT
jgi:hypothetical protein